MVTFIVVIIALLLASFILLTHTHNQFRLRTDHIIETVALADKGIQYVLKNEVEMNDTLSMQLTDEDYKQLVIHKGYWGTYQKVYSRGSIKKNSFEKTALTGSQIMSNDPTSLFINNNNRPLVLVGHTKIEGKAFLPERGVKSGNIAGQSYYNEKYIYGNLALSQGLPRLDPELLGHIQSFKKGQYLILDSDKLIDLGKSKNHTNSFRNPLKKVYSKKDILLSDVSLTGHIMVQSETKIIVDQNAKLEDIVLSAPVVEIKSNVKGNFQALATERILVGNDVILGYPSALVLQRDYDVDEANDMNWIEIGDHSIVNGSLMMLGKTSTKNYDAQIKIYPNTIIKGMVYCEQNLELRGTVLGSVYTDNFIIKEAGSIYQNHLYNAKINSHDLESQFVGLKMEKNKNGIAKWLY